MYKQLVSLISSKKLYLEKHKIVNLLYCNIYQRTLNLYMSMTYKKKNYTKATYRLSTD